MESLSVRMLSQTPDRMFIHQEGQAHSGVPTVHDQTADHLVADNSLSLSVSLFCLSFFLLCTQKLTKKTGWITTLSEVRRQLTKQYRIARKERAAQQAQRETRRNSASIHRRRRNQARWALTNFPNKKHPTAHENKVQLRQSMDPYLTTSMFLSASLFYVQPLTTQTRHLLLLMQDPSVSGKKKRNMKRNHWNLWKTFKKVLQDETKKTTRWYPWHQHRLPCWTRTH